MEHDWLLRMLALRIDDRAFLKLIEKWLKAGILDTDGQVIDPETGTPQGGIVSPVLANVYLHYALDLWFEKVVKKHSEGDAFICRYADDFVCGFRHEEDAVRFYGALPGRLEKFGLTVAPEKTQILRFSRYSMTGGRAGTNGSTFLDLKCTGIRTGKAYRESSDAPRARNYRERVSG